MDKFLGLSAEKQNTVINAALTVFGSNGYKKASINDIAVEAGISKSMVFHYFVSKKSLYLYLIEFCSNILITEIGAKFDRNITDFFERIKQATEIKVSVIKRYPALLSFMKSAFFETDREVEDEIKAIFSKGEAFRESIALDGMDTSKFKDGVDPKLVMKMLTWFAEGYVTELRGKSELDIDLICREFDESMNLLRQNLYKEKYL